jgi:hypothetical protein
MQAFPRRQVGGHGVLKPNLLQRATASWEPDNPARGLGSRGPTRHWDQRGTCFVFGIDKAEGQLPRTHVSRLSVRGHGVGASMEHLAQVCPRRIAEGSIFRFDSAIVTTGKLWIKILSL